MQMALDALDGTYHKDLHDDKLLTKVVDAIAALREALAQPESEPVAWIDKFGNVFPLAAMRGPAWDREPWKPLYLAPPAPKVQDGWKLAPIAPSPEMIQEGAYAERRSGSVDSIYKAMLAAAPTNTAKEIK